MKIERVPVSGPPPWGALDPGILPVVDALTRAGFTTCASSDGRGAGYPWVTLTDGDPLRIARSLHAAGFRGFTVTVSYDCPSPKSALRACTVRFWSTPPTTVQVGD